MSRRMSGEHLPDRGCGLQACDLSSGLHFFLVARPNNRKHSEWNGHVQPLLTRLRSIVGSDKQMVIALPQAVI